jgi:hypothetical protein
MRKANGFLPPKSEIENRGENEGERCTASAGGPLAEFKVADSGRTLRVWPAKTSA